MKLSLILVAAPAAQAMVSYMASVPESLMTMVDSAACNLPDDFQVQDFTADSQDGGQTVDVLDFTFNDDSTGLSTPCHLDASSVPVPSDGRTARYACDNALVQFIWQNGRATMIEKVCPGADGVADYEASGTAVIPLTCEGSGGNGTVNGTDATVSGRSSRRRTRRAAGCRTDSDDIRARFFSIQPVPDI
ncbi:hypothetical protein CCHL11_08657 [Colletotrichum chlorophyti]|uniref:AA1-like domain-containing protein n=1 Tax=Colletotrichum chlorophyti TaxID=708187 RepID=A0A1Q8RCH0_9PEZI|nr:hypothetical protein CCHL11_08657 [Colletotrichum chlorophyti]